MTETWYRIYPALGARIDSVQIDRATDSFVWLKGVKNARHTLWCSYYPTWEEARTALLNQAERVLDAARRALQCAQGHYGNVKGLKHPGAEESR